MALEGFFYGYPLALAARRYKLLELCICLATAPKPHALEQAVFFNKNMQQSPALAPQLFEITEKVNRAFIQSLSTQESQALTVTLQKLVAAHPKKA